MRNSMRNNFLSILRNFFPTIQIWNLIYLNYDYFKKILNKIDIWYILILILIIQNIFSFILLFLNIEIEIICEYIFIIHIWRNIKINLFFNNWIFMIYFSKIIKFLFIKIKYWDWPIPNPYEKLKKKFWFFI